MDPRLAKTKDLGTEFTAELLACLRFCTRLPLPALPFEEATYEMPFVTCARMLPIAGFVIGVFAAFILWIADEIGLPAPLAALIAISCLVLITGALHEDGLADFVEGTANVAPEQGLAVMRDSRIGTFGTLALIFGSLARVLSVAVIAAHSFHLAYCVLIATAAASRTLMLFALRLAPAARMEGTAATSELKEPTLAIAAFIGFVLGLLPLLAGATIGRVILALICGIAASYGIVALARHRLQSLTGDTAGATQQATEIAIYLVYAAGW